MYSAILANGGKPKLDPKLKQLKLVKTSKVSHLNPLPCLCNRSGAGTRTVSSLGGEIINGAGALTMIHVITWEKWEVSGKKCHLR